MITEICYVNLLGAIILYHHDFWPILSVDLLILNIVSAGYLLYIWCIIFYFEYYILNICKFIFKLFIIYYPLYTKYVLHILYHHIIYYILYYILYLILYTILIFEILYIKYIVYIFIYFFTFFIFYSIKNRFKIILFFL